MRKYLPRSSFGRGLAAKDHTMTKKELLRRFLEELGAGYQTIRTATYWTVTAANAADALLLCGICEKFGYRARYHRFQNDIQVKIFF